MFAVFDGSVLIGEGVAMLAVSGGAVWSAVVVLSVNVEFRL